MPTIEYTSRDFDSIRDQLSDFIKTTRPDFWTDFFESNLGVSLVELVAFVGDILSFGQDVVGTEVFLATARRLDSALRFARSVGYQPRSAVSAEVTVTSSSLPAGVSTAGAVVRAGAKLTGLNGLTYELLEDVTILSTDTVSRLPLFEGESFEEVFSPTNQANQEIVSANGVVGDGSWSVFVGDPDNPLNRWTQVDNVRFETTPSETYEAFLDGDGRLHVLFGDDVSGKIPSSDITLNYRTTNGVDGNSPTNTIEGSVQAELLSGGGGLVSIRYVNSEGPAAGGRDRESVDELRVNVPAFIKSSDRIITLADYNTSLLQVPGVRLIFTDQLIASFAGNVVKVHVWDEEVVTFASESPTTGDSSEVAYTRFTQVPLIRANEIQAFLQERTAINVHNIIVRPGVSAVDLYLGTVTYDSRFSRLDVHAAITQAVVSAFEGGDGFSVRISDVVAAVDNTLGVRHFLLERAVLEGLREVPAEGSITFDSNVSVGETVTVDDGENRKTFEFVAASGDPIDSESDVPVTIGGTLEITAINLQTGILTSLSMIADIDDESTPETIDLTSIVTGTSANVDITTADSPGSLTPSPNLTVVGMSGGSDEPAQRIVDYRRIQDPQVVLDPWPPGPYAPNTVAASIGIAAGEDPVDGSTITIQDGVGNIETFEFDTGGGVSSGNVAVTVVAGDNLATLQNLETAFNSSSLGTALQASVFISTESSLRITVVDDDAEVTLSSSDTIQAILKYAVNGWLDGGQLEYEPIQDIIIQSVRTAARFYDNTFLYNNEIRYDSGVGSLTTAVQAINLRRLVFDLVAAT